MRSTRFVARLITLGTVLMIGTPAVVHAACTTTICTGGGGNCTISGVHTIDDGCMLDWGPAKDVLVTGTLQTAADDQSFTLKARAFDITGTLRAKGDHAVLTVETSAVGSSGSPSFRTRTSGTIDVSKGGTAIIDAAGFVDISGTDFTADGGTGGCDAGDIDISGTSLLITRTIHADGAACGGTGGDGGTITLTATTGNATLSGSGPITANSSGNFTFGGTITLRTETSLTQGKTMQAKGGAGGDGGVILLSSETSSVGVGGSLNTSSEGAGSAGGTIEVSGTSVASSNDWTSKGDQYGGLIDVQARGSNIDIQAGTFAVDAENGGFAGLVYLSGEGAVTIDGFITANTSGPDAEAGTIDISAGSNHTLSVKKALEAKTANNSASADGSVVLAACNISVTQDIRTRNVNVGDGSTQIDYQGTMTLTAGDTISADDPMATSCNDLRGNVIFCRCPDANEDGACDAASCVTAPTLSGTLTPTALLCPRAMAPCG